MQAMVLKKMGQPLELMELPQPVVSDGQLLLRVLACGICRTDLHVVDGDLTEPRLPLVPGHQIVGIVEALGDNAGNFSVGQRVGVPWLGGSCGHCEFCASARENLCDDAVYTGYQVDGGFAEYTLAEGRYCFPVPEGFSALQAAPLLCAGLIGYRSWRPVADAGRLGFYGFGAAAHILIQLARYHQQEVYAFTRPGDQAAQDFALKLGARWAGDSGVSAPELLDGAIIFAPDGDCVLQALRAVKKGGKVVCAGIHMSDIPPIPYSDLWGERSIQSVANLTRADGEEFLPLAARIPIQTEVHRYPLDRANQALDDLRNGRLTGAAVLSIAPDSSLQN
ncbi:MAG: zinc-dependent alcohol dehydrogenase family protein [Halioglobus sp.]|nr:zinc-dependent alcohol dehydrogenase family protein [Halioglobus sp.]